MIREVKDPFGNRWWIDTHIEDLSREEVSKRMDEYLKKMRKVSICNNTVGKKSTIGR
jgi:formylmethanofuran dehydrogenase subunit A